MIRRNEKGAALPTVIMVMLVLYLLGIALLSVSSADVNHATVQYNKSQAHYLARSGVYIGLEELANKLAGDIYQDLDLLVSELNSDMAALNPVSVPGRGTFSITYERYSGSEIKIRSIGTGTGSPASSDLVTLRVRMGTPASIHNFPDAWYAGINLVKGISTANTYLGSGVMLEGNPTSSPMGSGGNNSTYQASIFYFTENIKKNSPSDSYISLRQVTNSVSLTFDGEIIFFVGRVNLNGQPYNLTPGPTVKDQIYLSLSEEAAYDKVSNSGSILYVTDTAVRSQLIAEGGTAGVGFESKTYYDYFREGKPGDYHNTYNFEENTRYGLVYFGKNLYTSTNTAKLPSGSGYYFFPSGVNLKMPAANLIDKLIAIDPDDGIIKALEDKFKMTVSSDPYLWGKE